jgi:hypothetical protein
MKTVTVPRKRKRKVENHRQGPREKHPRLNGVADGRRKPRQGHP